MKLVPDGLEEGRLLGVGEVPEAAWAQVRRGGSGRRPCGSGAAPGLGASATGMRAKDICLALDVEPLPKHVEGTRAKLKRLVSRNILTETRPGIFGLIPKEAQSP